MLPRALLESLRMMPVHFMPHSQLLFVGFSEDIDRTALYPIEQILGCRTEPCIIAESAMEQALESIRAMARPTEIVFETLRDGPPIARTIRDYALKLGAEEMILARPRQFLWARLRASGQPYDLLFRLPGVSSQRIEFEAEVMKVE